MENIITNEVMLNLQIIARKHYMEIQFINFEVWLCSYFNNLLAIFFAPISPITRKFIHLEVFYSFIDVFSKNHIIFSRFYFHIKSSYCIALNSCCDMSCKMVSFLFLFGILCCTKLKIILFLFLLRQLQNHAQ